ncbi:MAG: hypothetical protein JWQ96_3270 [Segetibacter sp.]|nr:hypothetical protein [Segetibacter sp.]
MKYCFALIITTFFLPTAHSQLEISTGYAVNKKLADGAPIHVGYDFKVKGRFYSKPQIGFKYLSHYNDFVGATIKVSIFELHQTISYEVIKSKAYILKPNAGLNYRFYNWKGKMEPPYNTLPQRAYQIVFRDDRLRLNSFIEDSEDKYSVSNFGFTFQLQNQFRLKNKVWFHITPFLEPDYHSSQNTGGCYLGVILKNI